MKTSEFVKIFNCLTEIQAKAGKVVGGTIIVGLPYRKAFELSVALKDMKLVAESYQETVNSIGKDMGLTPINGGQIYVFPANYPPDKANEHFMKIEELGNGETAYEKPLIRFTDADLEGIELNISGLSQQTFFEHLYHHPA